MDEINKKATIEVIKKSLGEKFIILWIDGGIWHSPGFEPRDAVWYYQKKLSHEINIERAIESVLRESHKVNVFIIGGQLIRL